MCTENIIGRTSWLVAEVLGAGKTHMLRGAGCRLLLSQMHAVYIKKNGYVGCCGCRCVLNFADAKIGAFSRHALMRHQHPIPCRTMKKPAPHPSAWTQGYVPATANAVRNSLLSLSSRESGGFRSAMDAAKEMMQEVSRWSLRRTTLRKHEHFASKFRLVRR